MEYNRSVCVMTDTQEDSEIFGRKRVDTMRNSSVVLFILITILAAIALFIVVPGSPGLHISLGSFQIQRDFEIKQGLDLQGGVQVLLEADLEEGQELEAGQLDVAKSIIEKRVNALGVVEPLVQTQGDRRIIVELPGVSDPDQAIATIKETGLLEFIDSGDYPLPIGAIVQTTYPRLESQGATTHEPVPGEITPPVNPISPTLVITDRVFATILTGAHLTNAAPDLDQLTNKYIIRFELDDEGGPIFADYTGRSIGKYASIVLDKEVISSPRVEGQIPDGQGQIQGEFTREEVNQLVVQLRYGALPVPLRIETTRTVGPTLGQDSVQRSIRAGLVGLGIVLIFMLVYYRLPGLLADLALVLYGMLNLAVYMVGWPVLLLISLLLLASYFVDRRDYWPMMLGVILLIATILLGAGGLTGVTLTLPAITGFILSTGMAVDANILVFERMKEELRAGRSLNSAIEAGFSRAWTSIRDSNISTLITCAILFYFGSTFGAGAVRGFAITLALGVIINIFTAITVTRTFMRLVFDRLGEKVESSSFLMGI